MTSLSICRCGLTLERVLSGFAIEARFLGCRAMGCLLSGSTPTGLAHLGTSAATCVSESPERVERAEYG